MKTKTKTGASFAQQGQLKVEFNRSSDATTRQVRMLLRELDQEAKVVTAAALAVGVQTGEKAPDTQVVWNCQKNKRKCLDLLLRAGGRAVALIGVKIVNNCAHIYICEPGCGRDSSDAFWREAYLPWLADYMKLWIETGFIPLEVAQHFGRSEPLFRPTTCEFEIHEAYDWPRATNEPQQA